MLKTHTHTKYNGFQLVSPEDLMGSDRTYSCGNTYHTLAHKVVLQVLNREFLALLQATHQILSSCWADKLCYILLHKRSCTTNKNFHTLVSDTED